MSLPKASTRPSRAQKRPKPFDPKTFLAQAGVGRAVRRYSPNQAVFSQGDRASDVFYIQNGRVRLSALSKRGKEATIAMLGPGDFLGEECLASNQFRHTTTAYAMTDCSILKIDKRIMVETLHEERGLSDQFLTYMIRRHNRTQADLLGVLFYSAERRLARALVILASPASGKFEAAIPRISQQALAEMVGTTRSRVNFFMNKFKKLGFIDYSGDHRGGLKVHSALLGVVLDE